MPSLNEIERLVSRLIVIATVSKVDIEAKLLWVDLSDDSQESNSIHWPAEYYRNYARWKPVRVGSQVVLACPSGDLSQAIFIAFMFSDEIIAPASSEDVDQIVFEDGTKFEYDSTSNTLNLSIIGDMNITVDGNATITAVGNAEINAAKADINTTGDTSIAAAKANITTTGDTSIVAAGNANITGTLVQLNEGTGVCTGESICHFTGAPHADVSTTVLAGK